MMTPGTPIPGLNAQEADVKVPLIACIAMLVSASCYTAEALVTADIRDIVRHPELKPVLDRCRSMEGAVGVFIIGI